jgi:hypothetical protein
MTETYLKDSAYRADADAWMSMMHGLTPADEGIFLQRLAKAAGKSIDDVRAQWETLSAGAVKDIALRRVVWFFKQSHGKAPTANSEHQTPNPAP